MNKGFNYFLLLFFLITIYSNGQHNLGQLAYKKQNKRDINSLHYDFEDIYMHLWSWSVHTLGSVP